MPQDKTYTVDLFCETHHISRAFFYQLLKGGKAPKIIKLGTRTLISEEAAAEWRKRVESETSDNIVSSTTI